MNILLLGEIKKFIEPILRFITYLPEQREKIK
jgi:hypothetical protein